jgi:hypothetical protein
MKISKNIKYLPLLLASTLAFAAEESAMTDKPYLYSSQTAEITASVEAIDHETRRVTLLKPDGSQVTFVASEEARNLDQVMVGDIVHAKYMESITIEVVANEGMEPQAQGLAAVARTEKGEMPGMAAFDAQVVTATVEEINIEANTYKLKGPDGSISEYVAMDPENLKRADVGDLVIITTAESLAISVEMGPIE